MVPFTTTYLSKRVTFKFQVQPLHTSWLSFIDNVFSPTQKVTCTLTGCVTSQNNNGYKKPILERITKEKPALHELCENICIVDKWYQLGIQLKLDHKKLKVIECLQGDDTYKTAKMFELWLDTNPHATRKQVIDALRMEVIEENTVAHEYEESLRKLYNPSHAGE